MIAPNPNNELQDTSNDGSSKESTNLESDLNESNEVVTKPNGTAPEVPITAKESSPKSETAASQPWSFEDIEKELSIMPPVVLGSNAFTANEEMKCHYNAEDTKWSRASSIGDTSDESLHLHLSDDDDEVSRGADMSDMLMDVDEVTDVKDEPKETLGKLERPNKENMPELGVHSGCTSVESTEEVKMDTPNGDKAPKFKIVDHQVSVTIKELIDSTVCLKTASDIQNPDSEANKMQVDKEGSENVAKAIEDPQEDNTANEKNIMESPETAPGTPSKKLKNVNTENVEMVGSIEDVCEANGLEHDEIEKEELCQKMLETLDELADIHSSKKSSEDKDGRCNDKPKKSKQPMTASMKKELEKLKKKSESSTLTSSELEETIERMAGIAVMSEIGKLKKNIERKTQLINHWQKKALLLETAAHGKIRQMMSLLCKKVEKGNNSTKPVKIIRSVGQQTDEPGQEPEQKSHLRVNSAVVFAKMPPDAVMRPLLSLDKVTIVTKTAVPTESTTSDEMMIDLTGEADAANSVAVPQMLGARGPAMPAQPNFLADEVHYIPWYVQPSVLPANSGEVALSCINKNSVQPMTGSTGSGITVQQNSILQPFLFRASIPVYVAPVLPASLCLIKPNASEVVAASPQVQNASVISTSTSLTTATMMPVVSDSISGTETNSDIVRQHRLKAKLRGIRSKIPLSIAVNQLFPPSNVGEVMNHPEPSVRPPSPLQENPEHY